MKHNIKLIIIFKLIDTKTPRTQIHTNKSYFIGKKCY